MKTLILSFVLMAASCVAQTNTIYANMVGHRKFTQSCEPKYWITGELAYRAPSTNPPNTWFFQTTNVHTISCTNGSAMLVAGGQFGGQFCGLGSSLTWTDTTFPTEPYRFNQYWSNNVHPIPSNQSIALTITGFVTNSP